MSGDTWTWPGEGSVAGKVFHTRYIMKFVLKDSYGYVDEWGEGEQPMELGMGGTCTRVAATKSATSKLAQ